MKDEKSTEEGSEKNKNGSLDTGGNMDKTMVDIDAQQFKKQSLDKPQTNPQTSEPQDSSKKGSLLGGLKNLFKK